MIHTIETFENGELIALSCDGNEVFTSGIHGDALRITTYDVTLSLHHGSTLIIAMWLKLSGDGVLSIDIDDVNVTIDTQSVAIGNTEADYTFGDKWKFVIIRLNGASASISINDEIVVIVNTQHTSDYHNIAISNTGPANSYIDIDDFAVTSDVVARIVSSLTMDRIERDLYSSHVGGDAVSAVSDFDDATYVEITGNSGSSNTCLYSATVNVHSHHLISEIAFAHRSKGDGSVRIGLSNTLSQTGRRKHLSQDFVWYVDSTKKTANGDKIRIAESETLLIGLQYIFD